MFFKKKDVKLKKNLFKSHNFYECRPFYQLKDQLVYSNCSLSFENEFYKRYKKIKKDYLITIYLIEDLDEFKEIEELKSDSKNITVYVLNNNSSNSINFAHTKGFCNKDNYEMVLLYNDEDKVLEEYVELQKNKTSYFIYLDVLLLYLGCIDNKEES